MENLPNHIDDPSEPRDLAEALDMGLADYDKEKHEVTLQDETKFSLGSLRVVVDRNTGKHSIVRPSFRK